VLARITPVLRQYYCSRCQQICAIGLSRFGWVHVSISKKSGCRLDSRPYCL